MRIHRQLISFYWLLLVPLDVALAAIINSEGIHHLPDSDDDPQHDDDVQGDDVVSDWCPGCRRRQGGSGVDPEEDLIQIRIERIKVEILKKLGLEAPPKVNANRLEGQIPEPLQSNPSSFRSRSEDLHRRDDDDDNDDDDDDPEMQRDDPSFFDDDETKQIIIFSDSVKNCQRTTRTFNGDCFHFRPSDNIATDDITSVQLWIYKTRHFVNATSSCPLTNRTSTLSVYALSDNSLPTRGKLLAVRVVVQEAGWMTLDLEGIVRSWINDPKTNRGIIIDYEIGCYDLLTSHQRYRPFLVIEDRMNQRRRRMRRRRRSAGECGEGSLQSCCRRHSLHIDFKAVNWTFIINPSGYTANYCSGPCNVPPLENLVNAHRRHSTLLQRYSQMRNNDDFLPCCSPTSFSDLSILYVNEENQYIREDLRNMRVESCGCS